jgi:hypothetical protein
MLPSGERTTVVAMTETPWEPPLAGSELEHLVGALERLRTTFRWKADDLDAAGLQTRIGASALTIGGLLKHLAFNEDFMFTAKLTGAPVGEPWQSLWKDETEDWEFISAADDSAEQLYAFWDDAVDRSRPGSTRRWHAVGSINSSAFRLPRASTPACAACCAT